MPEMSSVGDLEGLRGAAGGTFGEEGRTVTADDLDAGPLGESGRERVRLPIGKEVDRATCLDVDEHGSVDTALALSVLVHAGHCGGGVRSEAISLNRVFRLTGTLRASVIRAPARPASARPTDTSVDRSRSVRRPNLRVRPGTCSAKVMRSQDSSSQTNLRTRNDTTTSLPAIGRSRGNRR